MGMKIIVNGREYDGVESMPPEVRSLYDGALRALGPAGADKDGDVAAGGEGGMARAMVQSRIVINNQTFKSPDEMPAELRQFYEQAMKTGTGQGGEIRPSKSVFKMTVKPELRVTFNKHEEGSSGVPQGPYPVIEPSSAESGIRFALLAAAGLVGAIIAVWVLFAK